MPMRGHLLEHFLCYFVVICIQQEFKYPRRQQNENNLLVSIVLCTQQMPSCLPGWTDRQMDKGKSKCHPYNCIISTKEQLSKGIQVLLQLYLFRHELNKSVLLQVFNQSPSKIDNMNISNK